MKNSPEDIVRSVETLQYDFDRFELDHFIQHVADKRQRPIIMQGFALKPGLMGFWTPQETTDFLIYSHILHPIHQTHAILHEIGHMVLGHVCYPLEDLLDKDLIEALGLSSTGLLRAIRDFPGDDPQDIEAEQFAFELQKRVMYAQRLNALLKSKSSVAVFRPFADGMAFDEE